MNVLQSPSQISHSSSGPSQTVAEQEKNASEQKTSGALFVALANKRPVEGVGSDKKWDRRRVFPNLVNGTGLTSQNLPPSQGSSDCLEVNKTFPYKKALKSSIFLKGTLLLLGLSTLSAALISQGPLLWGSITSSSHIFASLISVYHMLNSTIFSFGTMAIGATAYFVPILIVIIGLHLLALGVWLYLILQRCKNRTDSDALPLATTGSGSAAQAPERKLSVLPSTKLIRSDNEFTYQAFIKPDQSQLTWNIQDPDDPDGKDTTLQASFKEIYEGKEKYIGFRHQVLYRHSTQTIILRCYFYKGDNQSGADWSYDYSTGNHSLPTEFSQEDPPHSVELSQTKNQADEIRRIEYCVKSDQFHIFLVSLYELFYFKELENKNYVLLPKYFPKTFGLLDENGKKLTPDLNTNFYPNFVQYRFYSETITDFFRVRVLFSRGAEDPLI